MEISSNVCEASFLAHVQLGGIVVAVKRFEITKNRFFPVQVFRIKIVTSAT